MKGKEMYRQVLHVDETRLLSSISIHDAEVDSMSESGMVFSRLRNIIISTNIPPHLTFCLVVKSASTQWHLRRPYTDYSSHHRDHVTLPPDPDGYRNLYAEPYIFPHATDNLHHDLEYRLKPRAMLHRYEVRGHGRHGGNSRSLQYRGMDILNHQSLAKSASRYRSIGGDVVTLMAYIGAKSHS
jgi:hypothetical protein